MSIEITGNVYARLVDLQSTTTDMNITIIIDNQNSLTLSRMCKTNNYTQYYLTAKYSQTSDLLNPKTHNTKLFECLILSMNLIFKRTVIIAFKTEPTRSSIKYIEQNDFNTNNVFIHENISVAIGTREHIDERKIFHIFSQLQKLYKQKNTRLINNIEKSIQHYYQGLELSEPKFIFQHMFNALEMATNAERKHLHDDFDTYVSDKTNTELATITKMRTFYNRLKHPDETDQKYDRYKDGLSSDVSSIIKLREITQKIIKLKLLSIDN